MLNFNAGQTMNENFQITPRWKYDMVCKLIDKFAYILNGDISTFHMVDHKDTKTPKLAVVFNLSKIKPQFLELLYNLKPIDISQYNGRFAELDENDRFLYVLGCLGYYSDNDMSIAVRELHNVEGLDTDMSNGLVLETKHALFYINQPKWGIE